MGARLMSEPGAGFPHALGRYIDTEEAFGRVVMLLLNCFFEAFLTA
jgi:hypothetical protein